MRAEEASRLAEAAVHKRQNRFTNAMMGKAYLVDGCALEQRCEALEHRKDAARLDPVPIEGDLCARLRATRRTRAPLGEPPVR